MTLYGYVLLPISMVETSMLQGDRFQRLADFWWKQGYLDILNDFVTHDHDDGGDPPVAVEAGNLLDAMQKIGEVHEATVRRIAVDLSAVVAGGKKADASGTQERREAIAERIREGARDIDPAELAWELGNVQKLERTIRKLLAAGASGGETGAPPTTS